MLLSAQVVCVAAMLGSAVLATPTPDTLPSSTDGFLSAESGSMAEGRPESNRDMTSPNTQISSHPFTSTQKGSENFPKRVIETTRVGEKPKLTIKDAPASTAANSAEITTTTDAAAETMLPQNNDTVLTDSEITVANTPEETSAETRTIIDFDVEKPLSENSAEETYHPLTVDAADLRKNFTQPENASEAETGNNSGMPFNNVAALVSHHNANVPNSESASSVVDILRSSLRNAENQSLHEDPVIEEAKLHYISVWNKEAVRLNASYLKVTKAWPEIGMVYMPLVTQMSDQIQNSEPVKEAAQKFKAVWKTNGPQGTPSSSNQPVLGVLNNFMSAWTWVEDENDGTSDSAHTAQDIKEIDSILDNLFKSNNLASESEISTVIVDNPVLVQDADDKINISSPINNTGGLKPTAFLNLPPAPIASNDGTASTSSASVSLGNHLRTGTIGQTPCTDVHGHGGHHNPSIPTAGHNEDSGPINPIAVIRPIILPTPVPRPAFSYQRHPFLGPSESQTAYPKRVESLDQFKRPAGVKRPISHYGDFQPHPPVPLQEIPRIRRPVSWPSYGSSIYSYEMIDDKYSHESTDESDSYESYMGDMFPLPLYLLR